MCKPIALGHFATNSVCNICWWHFSSVLICLAHIHSRINRTNTNIQKGSRINTKNLLVSNANTAHLKNQTWPCNNNINWSMALCCRLFCNFHANLPLLCINGMHGVRNTSDCTYAFSIGGVVLAMINSFQSYLSTMYLLPQPPCTPESPTQHHVGGGVPNLPKLTYRCQLLQYKTTWQLRLVGNLQCVMYMHVLVLLLVSFLHFLWKL